MSHIRARHHTLVLICIFSFFSSILFLHAAPVHAAAVPGGNIVDANVRAVDLVKPAVVRIITTIGGRISVRFPAANAPVTFPLNGGNYDVKISGSGTFVTSSGDIITADHVIKPPHDHSMDTALAAEAAQDIADYVNSHYATSTTYSKNDVMGALDSGYFLSDKRYTNSTSEVYLSTDYTGPINALDLKAVPDNMHAKVDSVLKESAVDVRDMALIHVKMTNTPSVQFGDSAQVAQQDNLTIIGFPGNGDISERKDPTTFLTSSINKIFVSALKKTDSGADVIQVGGNVEHGDSGGPALDANGSIVGIVSFGLESSPPYGSTFLQASNNAKTWLTTLHLDTRPGSLQRAWQQAFADYSATQPGHWRRAQGEFKQIVQNYPDFKAATPFLSYASLEAQKEPVTAQDTRSTTDYVAYIKQHAILLAVASALLILILLLAGWLVTSRRRNKGFIDAKRTPVASYLQPGTNPPPPSYPSITDSNPVATGARDRADINRYGHDSLQNMSKFDRTGQPGEQDIIPTQPLGRNTAEHQPPFPFEH
ncbi:MAG: hypothetical protein PVSMB5_08170 [Ktedonobacteraceae bacterium]